ncbi:unnamed protein product, partial [Aphanomyces euteiches]
LVKLTLSTISSWPCRLARLAFSSFGLSCECSLPSGESAINYMPERRFAAPIAVDTSIRRRLPTTQFTWSSQPLPDEI